MAKEINLLELRKHLGRILEEVHYQKQIYTVTKNGRPLAVLSDVTVQTSVPFPKVPGSEDPVPLAAQPGTVGNGTPCSTPSLDYTDEQIQEFLKED